MEITALIPPDDLDAALAEIKAGLQALHAVEPVEAARLLRSMWEQAVSATGGAA